MKRVLGPARTWWRSRAALGFLGYLVAHILVIVGLPTPRFPDSPHYLVFSVTGGGSEPPTVPFFYNLVSTDPERIALQTLIAAIAWWSLASVVAHRVVDRRVALGVRFVLLALGIVGPIASWNSTILSESLSISLTVLLIATWLRYVERRTVGRAATVFVTSVLWTDARQAQIYLSALILLGAALFALRRWREAVGWVLVLGLGAATASGLAIVDKNHYVGGGIIADTVADRILPNPGYTQWFVDQGMPYNATIAKTAGSLYGDALAAIPQWEAWNVANGTRTYLDFLLTHPRYLLWEPLSSFLGEPPSLLQAPSSLYVGTEPNPTPSMLSPDANYGRHRDVLPSPIEDLLFDPGNPGDVLLLAGIAGAAAFLAHRRRGRDRRLVVPIFVALSTIPHGYVVYWLGAVGEQDRLAIVLAVAVRVALWSVLAFSLDRIVTHPDDTTPDLATVGTRSSLLS